MRARPAAGVSDSLQAVTTCGHERLLSDGKNGHETRSTILSMGTPTRRSARLHGRRHSRLRYARKDRSACAEGGGAGQDALMKGSTYRCHGRFGGLLDDPFGQYTQLADLALVQLAGEVALHRVGEYRPGGGEHLFALGGERGVNGPPV
jgi:hypothetical protein